MRARIRLSPVGVNRVEPTSCRAEQCVAPRPTGRIGEPLIVLGVPRDAARRNRVPTDRVAYARIPNRFPPDLDISHRIGITCASRSPIPSAGLLVDCDRRLFVLYDAFTTSDKVWAVHNVGQR
jgi:hypothetical protein